MQIHPEGRSLLLWSGLLLIGLNVLLFLFFPQWIALFIGLSILFYLTILQFFRHPNRPIANFDPNLVYAPADGKVVVLEETEEPEYFQGKRLLVSIFMSPVNVHVNRTPVSGTVRYVKYHPGKYLVAWHPKSSTENERTTVVIDNGKTEILIRQIAGALAKRIKNYLSVGQEVTQGGEMGFIKFGSRVDIYLPLDAKVQVAIGDRVQGNRDIIAEL